MVYARTVGDADLTFIVSGKLWRNSLIMMDEQTGSLWSHVTGECLEGAHEGTILEVVPSVQTTWAEWRSAHPATRVLEKSEEITASHYEAYFADQDKAGLFRTQWLMGRMSAKALVHGVTVGLHAAAVVDTSLETGQEVETDLGGVTVAISRGADGGVRALRRDTAEELPVKTSFWFAWSAFYPNTSVLD